MLDKKVILFKQTISGNMFLQAWMESVPRKIIIQLVSTQHHGMSYSDKGRIILDMTWSGGRLNIKIPSHQYRNSHVKDKTASLTVLPESPYLGKTVFILRWGPVHFIVLYQCNYFLCYFHINVIIFSEAPYVNKAYLHGYISGIVEPIYCDMFYLNSIISPWCFLWSAPQKTVRQTIETQVIWDAWALMMTSSHCIL